MRTCIGVIFSSIVKSWYGCLCYIHNPQEQSTGKIAEYLSLVDVEYESSFEFDWTLLFPVSTARTHMTDGWVLSFVGFCPYFCLDFAMVRNCLSSFLNCCLGDFHHMDLFHS